MKLQITKGVFEKFHPQLKIAFIFVSGINNYEKIAESRHLLQETEKMVRLTFNKDTIKTHHLIKPWAVAQQEFGKTAKHYHTSVEYLLRKVLAKKSIISADVLTNLVRYLSLKHLVPMGVDDTAQIKGSLTFTLATRKKSAGKHTPALKPKELYYYDQRYILGTQLDFWKNPVTGMTPKSTAALIHLPVLPPVTETKFHEIIPELLSLLRGFCGGHAEVLILEKKKNNGIIRVI